MVFPSCTTDRSKVRDTASTFRKFISHRHLTHLSGYTGGADPANREALWPSGYEEDKDLVTHVKTLVAARKLAAAANSNFHSTAVRPCYFQLKPIFQKLT